MSQTKAQLISDLVQALNFTGTASAPANGAFLSATNTLALATNSAQRLTIKSDGGVAVGTTDLTTVGSPNKNFVVGSTTNAQEVATTLNVMEGTNNRRVKFFLDDDDGVFGIDSTASTGVAPFVIRMAQSEKLRIDQSGNVGIGTNSPTTQLHVQQSAVTSAPSRMSALYLENNANCEIQFVGNSSNDCQLRFGTSSNSFKGAIEYELDNNNFEFYTNGSERMRIDSSGNVGIGTTSPAANLHLKDGSGNTEIKLQGGASTANDVIAFLNSAGSTRGNITYDTDNDFVLFNVNTSERMRIDSSGRVLIGTTTSLPAFGAGSSLQVAGTGFASGSMLIRRDSDNAFSGALVFGKSRGSLGGNTTVQSGDQVGSIIWTAADGTDLTTDLAQIKAKVDGTPGSNDMPGRIEFHTTADGASGVTERMRINNSGNVGIGTTSPITPLHVKHSTTNGVATFESGDATCLINFKDNSTSSSPSIGTVGNDLKLVTADANRVTVLNTGNVGIGTESPGLPLHVYHATSNGILKVQSGDADVGITLQDSGGEASVRQSSNALTFNTSSSETERMRITSGGNVVVGGTSLGAAGSFGMEPNGHVRTVLASGTTGDTLLGAINGVSNGFQINISGTNSQLYRFHNGSTVTAQIDSDGLKFKNDTAAANALDDYEEGTWNPDPDDGNNVFTHGQEEGRYIKIGNIVHCTFRINVTLSGTSGFAMFMTGLPFTVKDFSEETNEGISTAKGTGQQAQLEAQQGQTKFKYRNPTSGAAMSVNDVGCTNNTVKSLRGAITYITT